MYDFGSNIALHRAATLYYKVTVCQNWIKPSNPMAILGHQTFHQKIMKYYELESDITKKKGRNITNWHPTSPRVFRGPGSDKVVNAKGEETGKEVVELAWAPIVDIWA